MAIKKFEMQRKRSDSGFDTYYPKTTSDMVVDESTGKTLDEHVKDTSIHVTASEKNAWNNKANASGTYANLRAQATTKADVGLGNVQNYGIATQAEAQAGTSNSKYMTPLRTKEAITALTGGVQWRINNGMLEYNDGSGWKSVGGIKSVQSGRTAVNESGNYVDVPISAVNVSKSFIVVPQIYGRSANTSGVSQAYAELLNSTTLRIRGSFQGASITMSWQVVEFY